MIHTNWTISSGSVTVGKRTNSMPQRHSTPTPSSSSWAPRCLHLSTLPSLLPVFQSTKGAYNYDGSRTRTHQRGSRFVCQSHIGYSLIILNCHYSQDPQSSATPYISHFHFISMFSHVVISEKHASYRHKARLTSTRCR
jgi:hypothetical protein